MPRIDKDFKIGQIYNNTGGTEQAIRITAFYNIPVINLFNDMEYFRWSEWLKMKHEFLG